MKKSELKSGMIVESRSRERFILVDNKLLSMKHWMKLETYNDNLLVNRTGLECLDIMKIYKSKEANLNSLLGEKELELIWEREEMEKEVTYEELNSGFSIFCSKSKLKPGCIHCKYYTFDSCEMGYIMDNYNITRK